MNRQVPSSLEVGIFCAGKSVVKVRESNLCSHFLLYVFCDVREWCRRASSQGHKMGEGEPFSS